MQIYKFNFYLGKNNIFVSILEKFDIFKNNNVFLLMQLSVLTLNTWTFNTRSSIILYYYAN